MQDRNEEYERLREECQRLHDAQDAMEREVRNLATEELRAEASRLRPRLSSLANGRMEPLLRLIDEHAIFNASSAWLDYGVSGAFDDLMRYWTVVGQLRQRGAFDH